MELKNVRYEQDGRVATITVDRPRQRNAISRRVRVGHDPLTAVRGSLSYHRFSRRPARQQGRA